MALKGTKRAPGSRRWPGFLAVALIAGFLTVVAPASPAAAAPCDTPVASPVACENTKTGNPESEWGISGAGSTSIQGFATDISVDQGGTIGFKVDTSASSYRLDIYRMGYYNGLGARKVATVSPSGNSNQPNCLTAVATGLVDCGNWTQNASWTVPGDAVSGIYFAKLVRTDGTAGSSHIPFVVRDDDGGSSLLFQTSDTTWQAYNAYGGNSLYTGSPAGRAYKVSYNRPFTTRQNAPEDFVFNAEYPMVRWLESNGYDVSYTSGIDTDRRGAELLEHDVFMSVGHDEYWSGTQRANVEAARAAGVHLAFFSGNEMFWKTRWESSIDGSGTAYRTLVTYKETHANARIDPQAPAMWTGTWRDPRFSPPGDGGRPENAVSGQIFTMNCCAIDMVVGSADGKMRFWRNSRVANLAANATTQVGTNTIGYEWDEDLDNGFRPNGAFRVSQTQGSGDRIQDHGTNYATGPGTHSMTLYRAPSGALVFGAGTVQWSWGLDSSHDRGSAAADTAAQQATLNLFADMGVQPTTMRPGLVAATASTDTVAPTSAITAPTNGANVPVGSPLTVTGTAADTGGGRVGGVEVSTDGGTTWHRATGRETWTYAFTPSTAGTITIRSRATDDSANIQTPGAGLAVTVGNAPATCPCSIWPGTATPAGTDPDTSPVELGVKFRASTSGFITGIRYYKPTASTGTHVGTLWTGTGTKLGTATFTNETASGWQQAAFANPIPVTANTTYVASYFTPSRYAVSGAYFANAATVRGPLTALQNGTDGGNGLYRYGSTAGSFPTSTYNTENYWVDVVFTETATDSTPPGVADRVPAAGATGVAVSSRPTATFTEPVAPASISMVLRNAGNQVVPATTAYDAGTFTATLTPTSALAYSSSYTVNLSGATDSSGNVMAPVSWTFQTSAPPPPAIDAGPGGPIAVVTSDANRSSAYLVEIVRAEGLNEFANVKNTTLTAATLAEYDVAVVGDVALTDAQITALTSWVNGGGNLILLKPDPRLLGLAGLTAQTGSVTNGYLAVNGASEAGAGITTETMQFHGSANRYSLSGATSVADLYTTATAAAGGPAVSLRSVGANGGQVATFAFDLAQSVIQTRQGNPAWAGTDRDGQTPNRANDLFFGGTATDWVNLNKVHIPQADEQQRLLANLVTTMVRDRLPMPRFWYFPKTYKAALVATGDDHAGGGTATRMSAYAAASPSGCSVALWECARFTSYVFPGSPLTNTQAAAFNTQGFEIGLHPQNGCANYPSLANLQSTYTDQLASWRSQYPSIPSPTTSRYHCIVWSDWASQPKAELANGIRLDTNFYYYPGSWLQDRPGFMNGSGMPMRFADTDGTMIDVYQANTAMTDESEQSYPFTPDTLFDRALGPQGYYGAFTANLHTDSGATLEDTETLASAQERGVPVISARQLLTWTDGRNASSFSGLTWSLNTLSFSVGVGAGATALTGMLPTSGPGGRTLTAISRGSSPVSFTLMTVKGQEYAMFAASAGSYQASYSAAGGVGLTAARSSERTEDGVTIDWRSGAPGTSSVVLGTSPRALAPTDIVAGRTRAHRVTLDGLEPGTRYFYRVVSRDAAGRVRTWPAQDEAPARFTTRAADRRAPTTAQVRALSLPDGTATVTWRTNEPATSTVWFGTSRTRLENHRVDGAATRVHRVVLTGLEPNRSYWVRVGSTDRQGNKSRVHRPVRLRTMASGVATQTAPQFRTGRSAGQLYVSATGPGALTLRGPGSGSHLSAVIDTAQKVTWRRAAIRASVPPGSSVTLYVRAGSTPRPDGTWSAWKRANGRIGVAGRYLQYRVELFASTADLPSVTAVGVTNTGSRHTEGESPGAETGLTRLASARFAPGF